MSVAFDDFDFYFISHSEYDEYRKTFPNECLGPKPTELWQIKRNHKSAIAFELFRARCNNLLPSANYGKELRNKGLSRSEIVDFFFELDERRPPRLLEIKKEHNKLIQQILDQYDGQINAHWVSYMKKSGLSHAEIVWVFEHHKSYIEGQKRILKEIDNSRESVNQV